MPTDLRAALRAALNMIHAYDGGVSADSEIAAYRAIADAPPTVAELLPMLPVTVIGNKPPRVEWVGFDGAESRARRTGAIGLRVEIKGSDGKWKPSTLCHADLAQPARLVEVTP